MWSGYAWVSTCVFPGSWSRSHRRMEIRKNGDTDGEVNLSSTRFYCKAQDKTSPERGGTRKRNAPQAKLHRRFYVLSLQSLFPRRWLGTPLSLLLLDWCFGWHLLSDVVAPPAQFPPLHFLCQLLFFLALRSSARVPDCLRLFHLTLKPLKLFFSGPWCLLSRSCPWLPMTFLSHN